METLNYDLTRCVDLLILRIFVSGGVGEEVFYTSDPDTANSSRNDCSVRSLSGKH